MISRPLICLTLLLLCGYAIADEPATEPTKKDQPAERRSELKEKKRASLEGANELGQRYLVSVAEFEVTGLVESPQTGHQMPELLFQKIKAEDLKPVEVVRLSTLANVAAHVQHNKRVQRVVSSSTNAQGRGPQQVQSHRDLDIGSTLEIKITADEHHSVAEVRFESARFRGDDNTTGTYLSSTIVETTVQVEEGQPILLGSTSEDIPRFFVLLIRAM